MTKPLRGRWAYKRLREGRVFQAFPKKQPLASPTQPPVTPFGKNRINFNNFGVQYPEFAIF